MTAAASGELTPGLMILQGNRLEELRELMVQWLIKHPLKPLENESILVQSNGIAQWLKMALAADREDGGCGIAAALQVDLPGRFIWQAYRSLYTELPSSSPFDKGPLTWRLYRLLADLETLKAQLPNPNCLEPLEGFLHQDQDPRRLHQLAANLADLYDQYQVYRADWLKAWEAGDDCLITAQGRAQPLREEQSWQPAIWRQLVAAIEQDPELGQGHWDKASRAAIHQDFIKACSKITMANRPPNLPRRVVIFGISSLPRQTLELLEALAPFTQILLFVSNPSQHYWGDLIEGKELLKKEYRRIRERKLPENLSLEELHVYGHPLLASWGKQGRDYLHLLDESDHPESYQQYFQQIDLFSSPGEGCLLHQLQSDLLELRSLVDCRELNRQLDPQDQSLSFMVAHSHQREVEILHDQLLREFEQAQQRQETLHPRDILVMVPDINSYAPAIQAVFGRYARQGESRDPRFLPFHISDQGQRGQNTLLIALEKLLHLPGSRFAVSELLDLLDTPALRLRYELQETDLPRLRQWIQGANIRWGLDGEQRASLELPTGLEENTWMQGLRRMLLGFASGSGPAWQSIEPYDEVAGLEAALIGPLVLLLEQLDTTRKQLLQAHTPQDWISLLQQLLADYFLEASKADTWALNQLQLQLEQLEDTWSQGSLSSETLPLEVVREELLAGIDQPTLTQKFLGGSINFATLMPMRAVPFQQVWLLGMNDGDYPRSVRPADFDLMAQDYRPGDRSRREDDRYLFLEALLSARQKLVISWIGRDIRDNSPRPPSVLVGQLRDHLAAGWQSPDQRPLLEALTQEHPLQPFSRRYFAPDRDPRLFTYAHEWRAIHHHQQQAQDSLQVPVLQPEGSLSLTDLAAFLRNPVQTFYRQRLGIQWQNQEEVIEDEENFRLDGLNQWALQKQLLDQATLELAQQPQADPEDCLNRASERLQRAGFLPLPPFADQAREKITAGLLEPLQSYQQLLQEYPLQTAAFSRHWPLSDELQLEAGLTDLRSKDLMNTLRIILQPSRLYSGDSYKWYHLIRYWPAHLFAQLQGPVTTRLLGPETDLSLPPLQPDQAENLLLEIAATWQEGWQRLLPLPCKTAFAGLEDKGKPKEVYEGGYASRGEREEHPALLRFWPTYAQLEAEPVFTQLAPRLYQPLVRLLQEVRP
ncbi:exodeoxyribonuclease V subunit gamma [Marinospirillum sp.]|uniref:exodeoxyribonuclease V subunit gamma n=1 Tax=Marinospirillum sp. TaxID=2183934 RepID=UPI00384CDC6D